MSRHRKIRAYLADRAHVNSGGALRQGTVGSRLAGTHYGGSPTRTPGFQTPRETGKFPGSGPSQAVKPVGTPWSGWQPARAARAGPVVCGPIPRPRARWHTQGWEEQAILPRVTSHTAARGHTEGHTSETLGWTVLSSRPPARHAEGPHRSDRGKRARVVPRLRLDERGGNSRSVNDGAPSNNTNVTQREARGGFPRGGWSQGVTARGRAGARRCSCG
jgi:hypothetical protein